MEYQCVMLSIKIKALQWNPVEPLLRATLHTLPLLTPDFKKKVSRAHQYRRRSR